MTKLYQLAVQLKDSDSHIGDLCSAILMDLKFPKFDTQENQISYLIDISNAIPNSKESIDDFIKIVIENQ